MINTQPSQEQLRQAVREKYAGIASEGIATGCCGSAEPVNMIGEAYDGVEGHFADADLGLGCGLPVEHAGLSEGDIVLDLGSGAGVDAFVARRQVGEKGKVIGVDFVPKMVAKARSNAAKLGYANVEFLEGEIEALPVAEDSVDVVISNCVLNLVPDKAAAFRQMYRVIRPGGHFCISDIVADGELPEDLLQAAELYAGCVSGAMEREAFLSILQSTGFVGVKVVAERPIDIPDSVLEDFSHEVREAMQHGGIVSITVVGHKH